MKKQAKKIKDIEIYSKQYLVSLSSLLIVFNAILWVALILMITKLKNPISITISVILFVFCLAYSIYTFIRSKQCHNYQLFEDSIQVNSILNDETINLANIIKIVPKVKVISPDTNHTIQSLDIYYLDKNVKKTTLRYIKEDVYKLAYLISSYISKTHNKLNKIKLKSMENKNPNEINENISILNKTTNKLKNNKNNLKNNKKINK